MVRYHNQSTNMVKSQKQITGAEAKALRIQEGLSQREFWEAVGVSQPAGCRYERSKHIPAPVRILIFAIYVIGIRIDASTPEGIEHMKTLASLQDFEKAAAVVKRASKLLETAV